MDTRTPWVIEIPRLAATRYHFEVGWTQAAKKPWVRMKCPRPGDYIVGQVSSGRYTSPVDERLVAW
jgi:hypothetical protein